MSSPGLRMSILAAGAIHAEVFCSAHRLVRRRPAAAPPQKTMSTQHQTGALPLNHRKRKSLAWVFRKVNSSAAMIRMAAMIRFPVGRNRCFAGGSGSLIMFLPKATRDLMPGLIAPVSGTAARGSVPPGGERAARCCGCVRGAAPLPPGRLRRWSCPGCQQVAPLLFPFCLAGRPAAAWWRT